jgi:hypothetical protein
MCLFGQFNQRRLRQQPPSAFSTTGENHLDYSHGQQYDQQG